MLTVCASHGFAVIGVLLFIFPLQSNTTDDVTKTFLAAREMSQFFGQNAEVRAARKKLTSDICRKILITKSYQAKPEFSGYEIKTGGEISSHVHFT